MLRPLQPAATDEGDKEAEDGKPVVKEKSTGKRRGKGNRKRLSKGEKEERHATARVPMKMAALDAAAAGNFVKGTPWLTTLLKLLLEQLKCTSTVVLARKLGYQPSDAQVPGEMKGFLVDVNDLLQPCIATECQEIASLPLEFAWGKAQQLEFRGERGSLGKN